VPFAFDVILGNLLGFRCLHRNHYALHAIYAGTRHVDHIFVKAYFCVIEFQQLVHASLDLLFGFPLGAKRGLFGHGFFQYKS
jgi:hypothetical protein